MLPAKGSRVFPSAARGESSSLVPEQETSLPPRAGSQELGQGQDHTMLALPLTPEHVSFLL